MGNELIGIVEGEIADSTLQAIVDEKPKDGQEIAHRKTLLDRRDDSHARKSLERQIRRYGNGYYVKGDFIYLGKTVVGYINFNFLAPRVELTNRYLHWKLEQVIPRDIFFVEYRTTLRRLPNDGH